MKTVNQQYSHEIEIKNSRFICYIIPLVSNEVDSFLSLIRREHPKATHYCYGYRFQGVTHSTDDGEPGGTAGLPILNVIEKENLDQILVVVVRYFGGIKLGAGGLVRAYTKSVTETLKLATFYELIPGYVISLTFPYEEEKNILFLLQNSEIINKEYLEAVTYTCMVMKDSFDQLSRYQPSILEECSIKKS